MTCPTSALSVVRGLCTMHGLVHPAAGLYRLPCGGLLAGVYVADRVRSDAGVVVALCHTTDVSAMGRIVGHGGFGGPLYMYIVIIYV